MTIAKLHMVIVFSQPIFICSKSTIETPEICEICSKLIIKALEYRIRSEYRKIRTRNNSVFGHFTQWLLSLFLFAFCIFLEVRVLSNMLSVVADHHSTWKDKSLHLLVVALLLLKWLVTFWQLIIFFNDTFKLS